MRIISTQGYNEMSREAAKLICAQVIQRAESVLGLATGSTPLGTYQQLIRWNHEGEVDFSHVTTINLDEYVGIASDNSQSYRYFMNENLFRHININPNRTNVPNGMNADASDECARYESVIWESGGIDLQLLGLGQNGHIGFNEPGAAFEPDTHCVELSESTIKANRRFFDSEEQVPRFAYTMGIRAIMQARHIVIIASGEQKACAVEQMVRGAVTASHPASILQLHNNVTLIGDEAALSQL